MNAVHILATVRTPALLAGALLVFRTLRVGFPSAPVHLYGNGLDRHALPPIAEAARRVNASFQNLGHTSHDAWITALLARAVAPFWICDTDIVFHEAVQPWSFPAETAFAGRFEPEFDEEWTGTRHLARLHTSLMWFDPGETRAAVRQVIDRIPAPWRSSAQFPLIEQTFVPQRDSDTLFYDSMAGLYQAGFGTPFTAAQNAAFDHLHCATYADLISPHLHLPGGGSLLETHRAIYENPARIKGLAQNGQNAYYAGRKPKEAKCPTIPA